KEEAHDYRYFPEPDLPPLSIDEAWIGSVRTLLPELPRAKKQRLMSDYGLSEYDARLLVEDRQVAEWFESVVGLLSTSKNGPSGDLKSNAKTVANWMLGEIARLQNEQQKSVHESKLKPDDLVEIITMVQASRLS